MKKQFLMTTLLILTSCMFSASQEYSMPADDGLPSYDSLYGAGNGNDSKVEYTEVPYGTPGAVVPYQGLAAAAGAAPEERVSRNALLFILDNYPTQVKTPGKGHDFGIDFSDDTALPMPAVLKVYRQSVYSNGVPMRILQQVDRIVAWQKFLNYVEKYQGKDPRCSLVTPAHKALVQRGIQLLVDGLNDLRDRLIAEREEEMQAADNMNNFQALPYVDMEDEDGMAKQNAQIRRVLQRAARLNVQKDMQEDMQKDMN